MVPNVAVRIVQLIRQTTEDLIAKNRGMVDAEEQVSKQYCMVRNVAAITVQFIRQTTEEPQCSLQKDG